MGQGGGITFINGTPHDWKRSAPQAHKMENWDIPKVLPAGQSTTLYIEWPSDALTAHIPEFAHETFTLSDTPFHFALAARRINGALTFQVILTNLTTENNPPGSTINIGFAHDGDVCFVLSGTEGNFTSTSPPIDWMQRNIGTLGPRPLREICMPGTHNSGMSVSRGSTLLATEGTCLCQGLGVYEQLVAGARYLDIRPTITAEGWFSGHYSLIRSPVLGDLLKTWQGMSGQGIAKIVQEVNRFTAEYKELVVISVSHSANALRDYQYDSPPLLPLTHFVVLLMR